MITKPSPSIATFELVDGVLEVGLPELAAIRQAVLDYLQSEEFANGPYAKERERFTRELEVADGSIAFDGVPRLNAWLVERKRDRTGVMLVRHTARTNLMILFFADLAREADGTWRVTDFGHRRVTRAR